MRKVSDVEEGLFVYALVEPAEGVGWGSGGIDQASVYAVPCGRLAAVVSRVHSPVTEWPEHLDRYGEILRRLGKCCGEVHPVLFGVVAKNERELCRALLRVDEGPSLLGTALEMAISETREETGPSHQPPGN
ncbi:MAG: GvpL/GvpF family gas vesicle protein [Planctomycetota bacterium]